MHILFLTDNFPPEVNAPANRTYEHCREWVIAGHEVTVVTCAPNFPDGKVFAGYQNRLWQVERMDGIRVIRVWTYVTANEGIARRTLDYVSYMISATLAAPFVRNVDIVIGTSPQFFTACAAYVVSRIKRAPYVFELRDLWPESIRAVGAIRNARVLKFLEKVELFLYRKAELIVSVTASFKDDLESRGIDRDKVKVVTNGIDLKRFECRPKDEDILTEHGLNGKFVVGYIGTHGLAHALETVLDAADLMQSRYGHEQLIFLLLGSGARKTSLVEEAISRGLDNVVFLDTVPRDQVARFWSVLDASIIHLKNSDVFLSVIPSKLFECMGMGIPVLHGVKGESARIVREEGVGLCFEPENAEELCECILRMKRDAELRAKLQNASLKAAPKYDRSSLAKRMLSHLEKILLSRDDRRRN